MKTFSETCTIGAHHSPTPKEVMDEFRCSTRKVILTIETSYLPPSDNMGSVFTATISESRLFDFVHMDYSLTTPENHLAAAMAVIKSQLWGNYSLLAYESVRDSPSYIFTFQGEDY